jgi:molybdate transport system substrate-binding protein
MNTMFILKSKHVALAAMLMMSAPAAANAAEVVVFTPGAVQAVVLEIAKEYEQKTGNTVTSVFDSAGGVAKRVAAGERGDVVITSAQGLANLAQSGQVVPASIRDLGAVGVGVAVRRGAPLPDVHGVEAFKRSLLAARSIVFADPAKGGQSGVHVAKVLAQLGIDNELRPRLRLRDRGPDGLTEVGDGTIEIGLAQISEILADKNVALAGPLPAAIQTLVTFSAAIHTASSQRAAAALLIEMLLAPAAKQRFKLAGFV